MSQAPLQTSMSGKSTRVGLLSGEQSVMAAPRAARSSEQLGQAPAAPGDISSGCDYDHANNRAASARGQQRATGRRARRAQRGGEKPKDARFSGGRAANTGAAGNRKYVTVRWGLCCPKGSVMRAWLGCHRKQYTP